MNIPFLTRAIDAAARIGGASTESDAPVVECHIGPEDDGAVGAGRGFLRISGHLGQAEYDQIAAAAGEMASSNLQAVGVLIDSGGGDLAGTDTAVKALVSLRTALGDRLFTLAEGMAGSAAYALLACGGRGKVLATSGASVGSIGPKIRLEDSSRLWTEGMLTTVHEITDGQPLKPIGSPGFPITSEALAFEKAQAAAGKQVFHALVAAARRQPLEDLVRAAGKGGLYHAANALDLGLVDGIVDKLSFVAMVNGEFSNTPQEEFPMADPMQPVQPVQVSAEATSPGPPTAPEILETQAPIALTAPFPAASATVALPVGDPPPDPMAAIAAQGEQIASLTVSVTNLADSIAAERQKSAESTITASIAAARSRIEACVPRITRSAADEALKGAEAMIRSGADPVPVIAMLEAAAPVEDEADLRGEVTYQIPGQEAQAAEVDLSYFSSPGRGGKAAISASVRDRALQAVAAVSAAPEGRRMDALVALDRQTGGIYQGVI